MTLQLSSNNAGGPAQFRFARPMMTGDLTVFAGGGLKPLLGRWTSTPLRGVDDLNAARRLLRSPGSAEAIEEESDRDQPPAGPVRTEAGFFQNQTML